MDSNFKTSIFDNFLIMSKILSYLPLSHVQQTRLVSKSWSQHSIQPLRKLTFIRLDFKNLNSYLNYVQNEKNAFLHSNFEIFHHSKDEDSIRNCSDILRLFYTIQEHHSGQKIRFLRIILGATNLHFLSSLIQTLPNLESLEIILGPLAKACKTLTDDINMMSISLKTGNLPSLKNLAFVFANITKLQAKKILVPLFSTMFNPPPPKLEKIEIFDKSKKSFVGGEVLQKIRTWNLGRLSNIQLTYGGACILKDLTLLDNGTLHVLKVGVVSYIDLPLLREVLIKHAGTLTNLRVEVSTGTTRKSRFPTTFEIPRLPMLERFMYVVGKLPVNLMIGSRKWSPGMQKHYHSLATLENLAFLDYMNISRLLGGGHTPFSRTFPSLNDLELRVCGGYTKHHDIFFLNVGPNVVIPQVKTFTMELLNWGSPEQHGSIVARLSKIFPNVKKPYLEGLPE